MPGNSVRDGAYETLTASGTYRSRRSRMTVVLKGTAMNNIIYIIGLIVIVLAILGFLGLR